MGRLVRGGTAPRRRVDDERGRSGRSSASPRQARSGSCPFPVPGSRADGVGRASVGAGQVEPVAQLVVGARAAAAQDGAGQLGPVDAVDQQLGGDVDPDDLARCTTSCPSAPRRRRAAGPPGPYGTRSSPARRRPAAPRRPRDSAAASPARSNSSTPACVEVAFICSASARVTRFQVKTPVSRALRTLSLSPDAAEADQRRRVGQRVEEAVRREVADAGPRPGPDPADRPRRDDRVERVVRQPVAVGGAVEVVAVAHRSCCSSPESTS